MWLRKRLKQLVCRHQWSVVYTELTLYYGERQLVKCNKCEKTRFFH